MAGFSEPAQTWISAQATEKNLYSEEEWQETASIDTNNER